MLGLTIIVPTRNEIDTLPTLLERIDSVLKSVQLPYEVVIIDDHSEDGTPALAKELSAQYPIHFEEKKGKPGKAYSLLQGFKKVKYDFIALLDADLQYPPEALPGILKALADGADVVVAQRTKGHPDFLRRVVARTHRKIFAEWLHNLHYDVQSGMKVFTKEVADRLPLSPKAWSFDLEFLLRARQAGYQIASVPVDFQPRKKVGTRKSNHNLFVSSRQITASALYHKVARPAIIPLLPAQQEKEGKGFHYNGKKFITHNELNPHTTALYRMHTLHAWFFFFLAVVIGIGLWLDWHTTLLVLVAGLSLLYFADLLFNFYLIVKSFTGTPEVTILDQEIEEIPDAAWPTYSIFCPLYKEPEVIPQFITAMSRMNYPQEKLQVMLLLEEDDTETIAKAKAMNLPANFEIQVVPNSLPKTKPKACNYGLLKATGEYVVIYDAEDVPDPDQLKKAVLAFKKSGPKVICIQAKLNFYNPHQNILTRVFTAEYSLWFDLVLTGIQSIKAPIPLGGTSNHFRSSDLRRLKGWDAFNVTEDCDLGMRLVKRGYQTAILNSTTLEEANSDLANWFWQRSRWIKGYMQSYFVHMRDPHNFWGDWRKPHIITFQLIVGGKVLSMLINPLMWIITISYFVLRAQIGDFVDSFFPPVIFYMAVFSLIFGNFLYLYYYMIGCAKRDHDELIKYAVFVPLYWLGMSLAAYMALYKLLTAPHHWSKTKHGLHLNNQHAMKQTRERIGGETVDSFLLQAAAAPAGAYDS